LLQAMSMQNGKSWLGYFSYQLGHVMPCRCDVCLGVVYPPQPEGE
jgi:hypothetical protein